ncbi:MAG: CaiB/BaiF CoA transferase family protein [Alphaproteobacteria bacterium]
MLANIADLVVVELGNSVAAPFAGQIFADFGAKVVKIEKGAGDDARHWGPPFWNGAGAFFQTLNRGKQSVVCDMRDEEQRAKLCEFIAQHADVVIQNMRPGQVEKLGLDAKTLCAANPALIYCNVGAFGTTGPLKDRPGYDPLMQAFGGIMATTGEPGRPSVRVGASIVDMGTGLWGVLGIFMALWDRQITGRGHVVDVALFETATNWSSLLGSQYLASGELMEKQGSGVASIVPYRAFPTLDGEVVVAAGGDELFRRLTLVLGHPEWASDPRFLSNPDRVNHQTTLYPMIENVMKAKSNATWIDLMDEAGIPCAPVQTLAQLVDHPQTQAVGIMQPVPGTDMTMFGLPIKIDGVRPAPQGVPPHLGAHNHVLFPDQEK